MPKALPRAIYFRVEPAVGDPDPGSIFKLDPRLQLDEAIDLLDKFPTVAVWSDTSSVPEEVPMRIVTYEVVCRIFTAEAYLERTLAKTDDPFPGMGNEPILGPEGYAPTTRMISEGDE